MEKVICICCGSENVDVEVKIYHVFGKDIPAAAYICQECGYDYMDSEQLDYLRRMCNGD